MNDWQKKVLELEESLNSFKESTTERFVKTGERLETFVYRIEDLETRTIELESKINPISCGNKHVSFLFLSLFHILFLKFFLI